MQHRLLLTLLLRLLRSLQLLVRPRSQEAAPQGGPEAAPGDAPLQAPKCPGATRQTNPVTPPAPAVGIRQGGLGPGAHRMRHRGLPDRSPPAGVAAPALAAVGAAVLAPSHPGICIAREAERGSFSSCSLYVFCCGALDTPSHGQGCLAKYPVGLEQMLASEVCQLSHQSTNCSLS